MDSDAAVRPPPTVDRPPDCSRPVSTALLAVSEPVTLTGADCSRPVMAALPTVAAPEADRQPNCAVPALSEVAAVICGATNAPAVTVPPTLTAALVSACAGHGHGPERRHRAAVVMPPA
jgi:hypothetical protein